MRANFSRLTFDRLERYKKHYAAVLHQQGRVWLDADWNEDVLARLHVLQQETHDIIGDCGTPDDRGTPDDQGTAFEIVPNPENPADFLIKPGRYYVHGILAELVEKSQYIKQPDLPEAQLPFSADKVEPGKDQLAIVYLEVWRRLITYLEDDELREIALSGPDTATRLKTVAQVKVALVSDEKATCETALPGDGHGTLTTDVKPRLASTVDPCRLPEDVDYTGRENRLYRVEIHEAGDLLDAPQFVSRILLAENAVVEVKKLVLSQPLADNELLALKNTGVVSLCDDAMQTELIQLDAVDVDKKTVSLKTGLKKDFTTAKHAYIEVSGPRIDIKGHRFLLEEDALAGETKLTLAEALEGATERSGSLVVSDDSGKSELVQFSTVDGKNLFLATALKNAFEKAHGAAIVVSIAQFKWSRDNAAFAVGVSKVNDDRLGLTLTSLGRDQATVLRAGDVVEISDDVHELGFNRGFLTTLAENPDPDELTVKLAKELPKDFKIDNHLILRRWDGVGLASAVFDPINTPDMDLGDGIHINFGGYDLRAGDYWTFAARSNDGSVERLKDEQPTGIRRERCPLALVRWTKDPDLDQPTIFKILGAGEHKLTDQQLETVKAKLGQDPNKRFDKGTILDIAKQSGATEAQQEAFGKALDYSALHFHIDDHCRKKFPPLTSIESPWPYMRYIAGDGQESKPDGTLAQVLQVAVFKGSKPLSDAKVKFKITEGTGGTLDDLAGHVGTELELPTKEGIATCKWTLEIPITGKTLPPRTQLVEASLLVNAGEDQDASIHFNACLGTYQFCYVGGDGQEAGDDNKLPAPLEVSVFDSPLPVAGAKVKFTIMDGHDGILEGEDSEQVDGTRSIIVPTNADGIASCRWKLDLKDLGKTQTVEARLLDASQKEILQPIHFHANIEREDAIAIKQITFLRNRETQTDLVNDEPIHPVDLIGGVDFFLDRELEDLRIVSRATCYVTVEAPISLFGDQLPTSSAYVPIVLSADVELVDKRILHWQPTEPTIRLLNRWNDETGDRLLTRITILGNFIWSKSENVYLDGDTFGIDAPPSAVQLPTGDSRKGGDFRMWFWLQRRTIVVDLQPIPFGVVNTGAPGTDSSLTIISTENQTITLVFKLVSGPDANVPFRATLLDSLETLETLELEAGMAKDIKIRFAPTVPGQFKATLSIQGNKSLDVFEVSLSGDGNPPM